MKDETLKTHYYFFSNEEGDGYEVYFCDYPDIKGIGDTYEEAYLEALERREALLGTTIQERNDEQE